MLSRNNENNKAVLATLVLMLLSLSVASSIAISAPYYASAQGVTGQGGANATNATMNGPGNATNATGATGANAGTSVSIVSGSSSLSDTAYQPNPIQVSVGNTVTWTNDDSQPHTVTSGGNGQPDNKFNSSPNFNPLMAPGQTFSFTFTQAGDYPYFCMLHPNMVGTVSVS
ncbi:MAG TPA: plastocyanin/azurin family copper-binding protein [Nitrososphaeraceae archaeon]|jgi:plastocyanin|nr:plastocyanin/azurin family copper-binding protein [Nitrososphaeraceae archaeon]